MFPVLSSQLNYVIISTYFDPGASVEFPTIRAMLRLSFKYKVDFISAEALRRLRCYGPHTLFAYGQKEAGNFKQVQAKEAIAIISLARAFNLPNLLPYVFVRICTSTHLFNLTKQVKIGGGDYRECKELPKHGIELCLRIVDQLFTGSYKRSELYATFKSLSECCPYPK